MVALATCSYQEFRPEMGQPVRISLGIPKFRLSWELPRACLWELAPRGHYFHDPPEEFTRKYVAQLDTYGPQKLHEIFTGLATGDRLTLLCFERNVRSGDDCHRRLFADWWLWNTGEYVPELGGSRHELMCCRTHDGPHVHGCILPGGQRGQCQTEED